MAQATRELLSVSSQLFDRSEEVYAESRRFVKHVDASRTPGAMEAVRRQAAEGVRHDPDRAAAQAASVERTIAACNTALQSMRDARTANGVAAQARTEAIAKKEAELAEQRTAFMADIAAKKRQLEDETRTQLQRIYAAHGMTMPLAMAAQLGGGGSNITAAAVGSNEGNTTTTGASMGRRSSSEAAAGGT